MKLIHRGFPIAMVKPPEPGSCLYCLYHDENSDKCPKNEKKQTLCWEVAPDEGIWIEDTPESMAAYVAFMLDPTQEDEL